MEIARASTAAAATEASTRALEGEAKTQRGPANSLGLVVSSGVLRRPPARVQAEQRPAQQRPTTLVHPFVSCATKALERKHGRRASPGRHHTVLPAYHTVPSTTITRKPGQRQDRPKGRARSGPTTGGEQQQQRGEAGPERQVELELESERELSLTVPAGRARAKEPEPEPERRDFLAPGLKQRDRDSG